MKSIHPSIDSETARMLLTLCLESGADEPVGEHPVNRLLPQAETGDAPAAAARPVIRPPPAPSADDSDPVRLAESLAASSGSLEELREAVGAYPHCGLREGARNLVFADGLPRARVMIVGEAPGGDEDRQGKPFVGRAGRLLDLMFREIGLQRDSENPESALYISNVIPWRPPGNRNPSKDEIAMMAPFVMRHVELAGPRVLVAVGNFSCSVFLGEMGITRLRGSWFEWRGIPVMPMFHPAYLLRSPDRKADAWHDLIMIRRRLQDF